jgi:hypothetical protein
VNAFFTILFSPFWLISFVIVLLLLIFIFFRRKILLRNMSIFALSAFVIAVVLGSIQILSTRSSTAAIGFIFLPVIALVPAVLSGLIPLFLHYKKKTAHSFNNTTVISLLVLLLISFYGWQGWSTYQIRDKNKQRDIESSRQRDAIKNNKLELASLLVEHPGNEEKIIADKVKNTDDRTWLIPLAGSQYANTETLNTLAHSKDFGVVTTALRHNNIAPEIIVWVFKNHTYPSYFFTTMSRNKNTPDWLLEYLYEQKHTNYGIAPALAINPSSPTTLINKLVIKPDRRTLESLIKNPLVTCPQLRNLNGQLPSLVIKYNKERTIQNLQQRLVACN